MGQLIPIRQPVRCRQSGHAAKQPFPLPPLQQNGTIRAFNPVNISVFFGLFAFGLFHGKRRRNSLRISLAGRPHRAQTAGRGARDADCRAKIHHRLREIAGPVGAPLRYVLREGANDFLRPRKRVGDGEHARDHTVHIPVDHRCRFIERDGCDGGGRIIPDPGKTAQSIDILWKHPAMVAGNRNRAFMKVSCPRVIPKPRPFAHHVGIFRHCQRVDGRPQGHEFQEIGNDSLHGRLLKHDFGQPDGIGVRPLPRQRPPGQDTAVPVIPA